MGESESNPVEERLRQLEESVARIENTLQQLIDSLDRRGRASPVPRRTAAQPTTARSTSGAASSHGSLAPPEPRAPITEIPRAEVTVNQLWINLQNRGLQFWISRVGIGLLLLSIVFLFDYAVDRGWLTPLIRVVSGLLLGTTLALIGFWVRFKQRWFAQLMLGGAAAAWYITGFAAFQLFHIVGHPAAFAFMVAVTAFTFWAGIRENEALLTILGAIGGLGTPFLLYTDSGTTTGLVIYTCIVLVGTSGIYLFKGWLSLLWISAIGGWSVLVIGLQGRALADRWAVQVGVLVAWLLFWLVPVGRAVLEAWNPSRWRPTRGGLVSHLFGSPETHGRHGDLAVLILATPLIALFLSRVTWTQADTLLGWSALGGTLLYTLSAWRLNRPGNVPSLVSAHLVTASVLVAAAFAVLFDGHALILLWAVLATAVHLLAKRLEDNALGICGHLLFGIVGLWLMQRIAEEGRPDTAVLNLRAAADAAIIGAGLLAATRMNERHAVVYRVFAHVAILGWIWRELSRLSSGEAVVTVVWGAYGITLLLAVRRTRLLGLATLLLVVAKLFLVDLSRVDPFLRILLFLGFGAVFLLISYYFRDLLRNPGEGSDSGG